MTAAWSQNPDHGVGLLPAPQARPRLCKPGSRSGRTSQLSPPTPDRLLWPSVSMAEVERPERCCSATFSFLGGHIPKVMRPVPAFFLPRLDDIAYAGRKETVELHISFKGKLAKCNTRRVFASQANHETCFLTVGVPKVRLTTQDREARPQQQGISVLSCRCCLFNS